MTEYAESQSYTAMQIAEWFIAWSEFESESSGITNLKLQKLLYFAQGHFLAKFDRPLFSDAIQAWEHGPVVPSVYHAFKSFKAKPIVWDDEVDFEDFDDRTNTFLASVWHTFGGFDGWKLREISHKSQPWIAAFSAEIPNSEIKKRDMQLAFKALYSDQGDEHSAHE